MQVGIMHCTTLFTYVVPSIVDALVAAVAEARDLTVLHYDADFELVAGITGQTQEWVVARGTAD
jgi:predicted nucleic acid-binding protein